MGGDWRPHLPGPNQRGGRFGGGTRGEDAAPPRLRTPPHPPTRTARARTRSSTHPATRRTPCAFWTTGREGCLWATCCVRALHRPLPVRQGMAGTARLTSPLRLDHRPVHRDRRLRPGEQRGGLRCLAAAHAPRLREDRQGRGGGQGTRASGGGAAGGGGGGGWRRACSGCAASPCYGRTAAASVPVCPWDAGISYGGRLWPLARTSRAAQAQARQFLELIGVDASDAAAVAQLQFSPQRLLDLCDASVERAMELYFTQGHSVSQLAPKDAGGSAAGSAAPAPSSGGGSSALREAMEAASAPAPPVPDAVRVSCGARLRPARRPLFPRSRG